MNKSVPVSELAPAINVTGKPSVAQTTQLIATRAVLTGYFQQFVDGREPRMDALPVFYVPCLDRSFVGPGRIGNALLATGWVERGLEVNLWGDVDANRATINRCSVAAVCNETYFH